MSASLTAKEEQVLAALRLWQTTRSRGASTAHVSNLCEKSPDWARPALKALRGFGLVDYKPAPNGHSYWWIVNAQEARP